ncbi:baseplate J/gp47 family protein [Clostridium aciditolerans]|uniref:Baseplate J/gp47 family protein n=1 Tax=Clostridium aciditolerans TaxID=339861 RepID=A0A934M5M0_9CLOT|nr:baseplate J/gp47 family protein [Clostridium aciditolerans]MBI6873733.1 baseplate J/gp47 family protein [Clostridium aciditolerans]
MYTENNLTDDILKRMIDNIPSDVDKSEGSFIYDSLSPVSKELEKSYASNDDILRRTDPYRAIGEDLEKITKPYGITRKPGKKALAQILVKAVMGTNLKSGSIFQTKSGLVYKTIEDIIVTNESTIVSAEASEVGSKYNVPANIITEVPVQISGIISVTNPNPIKNGYDVEDDESLRKRYFERLQTPATSGNKYHYRNWAKEVTGVGDAKVFPLWNGNGTVKVIIINSNKRAADSNLVNAVKNHIEENRPIGSDVTVVSAKEKLINISVTLVIDTKLYTLNQVQASIENNLIKYFKEISFIGNYISYASIGNLIFNTDGVIDYSNLLVNGGILNVTLEDEEMPVLGTVSLGV